MHTTASNDKRADPMLFVASITGIFALLEDEGRTDQVLGILRSLILRTPEKANLSFPFMRYAFL